MKGILVPETETYVGLIELVKSAIGIRGPAKTIVMRYSVESGLPLVRIQCDADYAAKAMPPELGESNHIDVQLSRNGVQSDEAMQHVDDRNLIIPPPPPHIPHLHPHVDELKFVGDARQSNENSIAASIGAHSIANNTTSQSVNVPSSDSQLRATRMRGSELFVVKRYDDVHTCSIKIVQGHHHQAKSWMIGECVKAKYLDPTNTSYRPREIMQDMQAEFGVSFNYLKAWRGKEAALTSLRGDDAESYNVLPTWAEMVKRKNPGFDIDIETDLANCLQCFYMCLAASKHACGHDANGCIFPLAFGIVQSESNESWKWFFEKLRDSIGTRESLAIVADRHKGIEFVANLMYPDAAFGIYVQHLAANLKTKYKDFKGPLKTYFDGALRSYILSEHHRHMKSIRNRNPDMHRYLLQADPTKWSRAYFNRRRELQQRWFVKRREEALKLTSKLTPKAEKLIRTNFSIGLIVTPWPADQFEYAITNNASQIWIVDMSERTCTWRRFQVDQIPCPYAMVVLQMAGMFLKKSGRILSILTKQSMGPEGHGFEGFCPKEKNMSLFGVVDVMVMDTTDKPVPIQYP
ncbi:hypothetical protein TIFTF001_042658 [Ficus carica]|uniref:Zinc finger PMZ-type domain-containing protein n=1 Tax=Ficus carica TaxID=3494 RepID=A0AA87ZQH2_FICCA|nr:hypothetical protein TIFTF001_042658 [Ficus carica]